MSGLDQVKKLKSEICDENSHPNSYEDEKTLQKQPLLYRLTIVLHKKKIKSQSKISHGSYFEMYKFLHGSSLHPFKGIKSYKHENTRSYIVFIRSCVRS